MKSNLSLFSFKLAKFALNLSSFNLSFSETLCLISTKKITSLIFLDLTIVGILVNLSIAPPIIFLKIGTPKKTTPKVDASEKIYDFENVLTDIEKEES